MSAFTVASGPIHFGASGGDEDFFGGSSTPNDQAGFTAAAAYAPSPEPSSEFPTTSYANAPWDVSGGYTAQEPATYPAAQSAAADDNYTAQPPLAPYSNPLYDATATYQPPQATNTQPWAAPGADAAPAYAYNQPAASPQPPPPSMQAQHHSFVPNYAEPAQEGPTSQWNPAPAEVPSYEDSVAKRELSFNQDVAPSPQDSISSSAHAPVSHPPVHQPAPWPMPAPVPSGNFTEDGEHDDEDAALFDQIDATFSENLDTDSLFSSSIATTATAAAAAAGIGSAPNSATATSATTMPFGRSEQTTQRYPFSPPAAMTSQARTFVPSRLQAPPPQPLSSPPPPPPMSPPRFQPPPPPPPATHPPPTTALPAYQYGSTTVVPRLAINAINQNITAPPAPSTAPAPTVGSGPVSRVSSLSSSPRPGNVNLEAGRRKLEEYKRRKQAVLGARKTTGTSGVSSPQLSGANSGGAVGDNNAAVVNSEKFQAELSAAVSRATAAEASSAELSRDLDHVLRQLETVDQERNSLQREKAAMVGEMMALQAALETAQNQAANYENVETKVQNAEMQIQELESARNDLINLLEKERFDHRQQLETLQSEKNSALAQGDESSQRAAQHVEEVQQWIAATQADSQAVREENNRLQQELDTALAAAANTSATDFSSTQQQIEQNTALQQEVANLHAQLESERAQRSELEAALSSSHQEYEQERQLLMDQTAQLQSRIQELELQQQQQQQQQYVSYADASGAGDGAYGGDQSFIKQEDHHYQQQQVYDQQQYDPQAPPLSPPTSALPYYQTATGDEYTNTMNVSAAQGINNNSEELEHALARAQAAESDLETLKNELESTRQEAMALRENVSRLQSEAAAMDKLHLDSPSNSRRGTSNDPESLRYRLAKAEAAVEKERRMIQALERQVREGEAAAAEGRASTAAAFELRRRCDAAEREATATKALVEQLQSAANASSGAMPDAQVQQMLSRLRVAEEKAISTDAIASDLRSQCDAAAKTIAKLVDENQNLMDRLNRQGNAMAELQESQHQNHQAHQQQPLYSPGSPYAAATAATAHRGGYTEQQQQQQPEFNTPVQSIAPPVWNIPGAVPIQPPLQQQGGGEYYHREEEIQENGNNGVRGYPHDRGEVSPRYSQEATGAGGDGGRKKKGFWSWLAGEDLVD